jgi:putative peptidoglycan lipid II flippase
MKHHVLHVAVLNGLAQAAGFGKAVLIAYYFGVGAILDGYYLAQAFPTALIGIAAGCIQTGFLPAYAACISGGDHGRGARLLGRALLLAACVGLAVSTLMSLAAPQIIGLLGTGSNTSEGVVHAVTALRLLAFILLLNMLADCLSLALNAHGKFVLAATAPIANVAVASLVLLLAPTWGLHNLIVGTLAGVSIQLLITIVGSRLAGIRPSFARVPGEHLRFEGGASILPGQLFFHLSSLVPVAFAIRLGEGSVTVLAFAMRLNGAVTQVAVIAVSTVLLPYFANALAAGRPDIVLNGLRASALPIALLGLVVTAWVVFAGPAFIAIAFERGAFDAQSTALVATAWVWLAIGLAPLLWGTALAKALQAKQLGSTLSAIAFMSLVTQIVVCSVAWTLDSIDLLAFAISTASLVAAIGCTAAVRRHFATDGAAIASLRYTVVPFSAALVFAISLSPHLLAFREAWQAGIAIAIAVTAASAAVLVKSRRAAG